MPECRTIDVQPVTLQGETVRLEPVSLAHAAGFAKYGEPGLFRYFGGVTLAAANLDAATEYIEGRMRLSNTVSFAMVLQSTGEAVGHSSYMSIRPADRVLEIGATWIGKPFQGTKVNPEAKLLMIGHAFEILGCVRVELKTDERNLQSQNAMSKLGLVREGMMRKHCINGDGYIRNTVYFSVVDDEWPAMKERLINRLASMT